MVADVLDALAAHRRDRADDRRHRERGRRRGRGRHGRDGGRGRPPRPGQRAAVALGVAPRARARASSACCASPATAPRSTPAELDGAAAPSRRADAAEVVIVPDRHGTGTNGLLLAPPGRDRAELRPGQLRAPPRARAAPPGARWRVERPASLLLDIDTGDDLAALRDAARAPAPARRRARARVLGPAPNARSPRHHDRGLIADADVAALRARALARPARGARRRRPRGADRRGAARRPLPRRDGRGDRPQGRLQGRGRARRARATCHPRARARELAAERRQGRRARCRSSSTSPPRSCAPSAAC